jgi:hypothetical protein
MKLAYLSFVLVVNLVGSAIVWRRAVRNPTQRLVGKVGVGLLVNLAASILLAVGLAIRNLFGSADDQSLFMLPLLIVPSEYMSSLLVPIVLFYLVLGALSTVYVRRTLRSGK